MPIFLFFLSNFLILSSAYAATDNEIDNLPGCDYSIYNLSYFLTAILVPWILAFFFLLVCLTLWKPQQGGWLTFKYVLLHFSFVLSFPLRIVLFFVGLCTRKPNLFYRLFSLPYVRNNQHVISVVMPMQQINCQPPQFIQSPQIIMSPQPINGFPQYSETYASYQGQQPMNITSTIHKKEEI